MSKAPKPPLEEITIESPADLRRWLACNHAQPDSIWVITWKKDSGRPHVPWSEIVAEALCFGWIDSLPRKVDAARSAVLLSPRKPRSGWSAINKRLIERLQAEGRIAPPGLAAIAAAKADGSWSLLDSAHALEVPDDLTQALESLPGAATAFAGFPASIRRGILEWIALARRAETRANRIRITAEKAARGERAR